MTQKAFSLDHETIQKIAKGFAISLGGALLAGFVMLAPEVSDYIATSDPINWRNVLLTSWGAFSTGLINAVREYVKGI